jgi:hypothetical protein
MKFARELLRHLVEMFVDDENLALIVLGIIGIAGFAAWRRGLAGHRAARGAYRPSGILQASDSNRPAWRSGTCA